MHNVGKNSTLKRIFLIKQKIFIVDINGLYVDV